MSRLGPLSSLSPAQREVRDEIAAGPRNSVPALFEVWLRSPELCARAQRLGVFLRYGSTLAPRLSELAILVTARHWSAQFEWGTHVPEARRAGLDEAIIAALRDRRRPDFTHDDERIIHAVAQSLQQTGGEDDALFAEAHALLGETALVELVGVIGYYTMGALTLNAFAVPAPAGTPPLDP